MPAAARARRILVLLLDLYHYQMKLSLAKNHQPENKLQDLVVLIKFSHS